MNDRERKALNKELTDGQITVKEYVRRCVADVMKGVEIEKIKKVEDKREETETNTENDLSIAVEKSLSDDPRPLRRVTSTICPLRRPTTYPSRKRPRKS